MKQRGAMSRHQSQAIIDSSIQTGAAVPATGLPAFVVKRGRGGRLYDMDGNARDDFWLSGGRLPFGHAPAFAGNGEKNGISTGHLEGYLTRPHLRLLARLAGLFPGYTPRFADPAAVLAACARQGLPVSDERATSFCRDMTSSGRDAGASVILVDGAIFLPCVLFRPGAEPDCVFPLPAATAAIRAETVLRRLTGPDAPWEAIGRLIALFRRLLPDSEMAAGFPKIEMTAEQRMCLSDRGFLVGPDNIVRFCDCHDPRTVRHLARTITELVSGS